MIDDDPVVPRVHLREAQSVNSAFLQRCSFDVRLPNAATRRALEDAEARRGLTSFATTDELFADLGI
jgi:hypothetical protein